MTERGAALEAGDIEAVVTVALLSQWFDGAPRGYLKRNINTNIMQQGVGVDSPTSNGTFVSLEGGEGRGSSTSCMCVVSQGVAGTAAFASPSGNPMT